MLDGLCRARRRAAAPDDRGESARAASGRGLPRARRGAAARPAAGRAARRLLSCATPSGSRDALTATDLAAGGAGRRRAAAGSRSVHSRLRPALFQGQAERRCRRATFRACAGWSACSSARRRASATSRSTATRTSTTSPRFASTGTQARRRAGAARAVAARAGRRAAGAPRSRARATTWARCCGDWPDRPPLIIDESDGAVGDVPRALSLGYAGASHKNCKGIVKGIANAARLRLEQKRRPARRRS